MTDRRLVPNIYSSRGGDGAHLRADWYEPEDAPTSRVQRWHRRGQRRQLNDDQMSTSGRRSLF